ncbi:hypothetical protein Natoc_2266 [Natronococcus occultus SP4]|uniref:Uncharacterized protein n=1 Tax=Natronococcus occultus SP4 TaxID=694430 RepID=L0K112_9EURY|nr:hypothetical protein Natoc_2266 [Natronococcus occultus SP4]
MNNKTVCESNIELYSLKINDRIKTGVVSDE